MNEVLTAAFRDSAMKEHDFHVVLGYNIGRFQLKSLSIQNISPPVA